MKKRTTYQGLTYKEENFALFLWLVIKGLSFAFIVTIMLLVHFCLDNRQKRARKRNIIELQNVEYQTLSLNNQFCYSFIRMFDS